VTGGAERSVAAPDELDLPGPLKTRLAQARHRLLALDFDGTLAPYAKDPRDACAVPQALEALTRLAARAGTTVAIVSGRPIPNLTRVVPIETVHLVGEHGWEERRPGGEPCLHPLADEAGRGLERLLDALTREGTKAKVERKRTGVAIHTRALDESGRAEAIAGFRSVYERVAHGAGLRLDVLDGGAEAHALGHDKGTAVRRLLAALPPETLALYVGDDVTDEPAFEAVRENGWGFKVGPVARATAARYHLAEPLAVARLLARVLDL
jgi:trehalose 6-phosphate phosphatase